MHLLTCNLYLQVEAIQRLSEEYLVRGKFFRGVCELQVVG